jgi:hypothetical protein
MKGHMNVCRLLYTTGKLRYVTRVSGCLEKRFRKATIVTISGERLNEKPFEGDGDLHPCVGHGDCSSADNNGERQRYR